MRLDKLMSINGYGSRKQVKRLVQQKKVIIDSQVILNEGYNVEPAIQQVLIAGKELKEPAHVYYMLNKPNGAVSAVRDTAFQTVVDLIKQKDQAAGLFPVGRLDRDTEGLQLLTNNGQLAHQLLQPQKKVTKCYEAIVNEIVTEEDQKKFSEGIIFEGGFVCKPAKLIIKGYQEGNSIIEVSITEGQLHQVKKMFLAVGKKVVYLKRISMGPLFLDKKLSIGEYRPLTYTELLSIKPYFNK